jgi:hypothetical protein
LAKRFFDQMIFGQMIFGQMIFGQMIFGQMIIGQVCFGQMIFGQMIFGQMMLGQACFGQLFFGQMSRILHDNQNELLSAFYRSPDQKLDSDNIQINQTEIFTNNSERDPILRKARAIFTTPHFLHNSQICPAS